MVELAPAMGFSASKWPSLGNSQERLDLEE